MRAIMIVGLLAVMLIIGILTMQQMGVRTINDQTEIQGREYIDRAEDTARAVEKKMQGLEKRLDHAD